jgi:predicted DNA-binding transcriptional regulator YafY
MTTTFVTLDQLAERWGKSPKTIKRWLATGLPGTRAEFACTRIGQTVMFTPSQIANAEASMVRVSTPPRTGRRRRTAA